MSKYSAIIVCATLTHAAAAQMTRSVDRAVVAGAAAAALRSDGTFALPDSVVHPAGELSEEDASAIAEGYFLGWLPGGVRRWSARKPAIDAEELTVCARPVYARSAYQALEADVSTMTRRRLGPHWIVAFCRGGRPSTILTFSALATDLRAASEEVRRRAISEAGFTSISYPASANPDMFSPEGVAHIAFLHTGKRVTAVPDLIDALPPASNAVPRWRVTLESPVLVRGQTDSTSRSRSTLYVGFSRIFLRSGLLDALVHPGRRTGEHVDPITHTAYRTVLGVGVPDSLELVTVIR